MDKTRITSKRKGTVCNFCLQLKTTCFNISEIDVEHKIKIIFPTKDINNFKNSTICNECLNHLKTTYDFIKDANEINRTVGGANIESGNRCQTCIKPVKNGAIYLFDHFENAVPYYEIKEMLDYSSLELDIEYCQRPIICTTCWETLKETYSFVKRCVGSEITVQLQKENEHSTEENPRILEDGYSLTKNALENGSKETVNREIKIEIPDYAFKAEPVDDDDHSYYPPTETDKCSITNLKDEKMMKGSSRKELYVKLARSNMHRKHVKSRKSESTLHECNLCPFTATTKYKYNRHMTTHKTLEECAKINPLYECHKCTYRTKLKYCLTRHLKEVHRSTYVCEKCNFETNEAELFRLHSEEEHNNSSICYPCTACHDVYYTKVKLRRHMKTHDLEHVIVKCTLCDFETRRVASLDEHKMSHRHMKVGKVYKCDKCPYEVKKKSNIERHILTHLSRRQLSGQMFTCGDCQFKTKRKDVLVGHVRNHHQVDKREAK